MGQITIEDDEIAIIWSVEDVMQECNWLTRQEALDVLHDLKHNHEADIGINWEVIHYKAQCMYPARRRENLRRRAATR